MRPWANYLDGYQDTADQLRQHLWERAAQALARARLDGETPDRATFEQRRDLLRSQFLSAIGGLPSQRTPLRVQLRGVLERPDCRIEKLIYESQPSFHVTANIYIPRGLAAPVPAVLFVCGHSEEGKAYPSYQMVCRDLVRAGFVVLAIDPLGQGERMYYYNPATGAQDVRWGTTEHSHAGFQCTLTGTNIARYFIWDAIRAIDLLAERPEVDAQRIGVTGNSGGGTQTSLLLMAETRLAAAVTCTYINQRQAYLATGQAHDAEQNIHGAIRDGLDYDDTLAMLAPRPVQLGAVASDFFPVEGVLVSFQRLRRLYGLYDATANVRLVVDGGLHRYSPVLRREAVAFFRKHLKGEAVELGPACSIAAGPAESPLTANIAGEEGIIPPDVEAPADLLCTASGQLVADFGERTRTVFELNRSDWRIRRASLRRQPSQVRASLEQLVRGDRARSPLWARRLGSGGGEAEPWWQHVYFFSEPGIAIAAIEIRSPGRGERDPLAVVACDEGTPVLGTDPGYLQALAARYGRLLLVDPRGVGSVSQRPVNAGRSGDYYATEYRLNYDAMMLGDSLFAMRAYDVERCLEYARRIAPSVSGVGRGVAGLWLLTAAALRGEPISLVLEGAPRSWEAYVEERLFDIDFRMEVFGVLCHWDVDDLVQLVEMAGGKVEER